MSVEALARAWDNSIHKGSELLVLVAIAENSNDDTDSTYLSIEFLCWKTRLSRRSVQRIVRTLEASGELLIMRNRGRNGTNVYRINTTPGNYDLRPNTRNVRFDAFDEEPSDTETDSGGAKLAPVSSEVLDAPNSVVETPNSVVEHTPDGTRTVVVPSLEPFENRRERENAGDHGFQVSSNQADRESRHCATCGKDLRDPVHNPTSEFTREENNQITEALIPELQPLETTANPELLEIEDVMKEHPDWPAWYAVAYTVPGWTMDVVKAEGWRVMAKITADLAERTAYALRDWWPTSSDKRQKKGDPYKTWQNWCRRDRDVAPGNTRGAQRQPVRTSGEFKGYDA